MITAFVTCFVFLVTVVCVFYTFVRLSLWVSIALVGNDDSWKRGEGYTRDILGVWNCYVFVFGHGVLMCSDSSCAFILVPLARPKSIN